MQTIKVFAASAALTVATAETQQCQTHTVNFEAARRVRGTAYYNWDEKLVLQVSPAEKLDVLDVLDVLAVLAGWKAGVACQYHGPRRNKGNRLQHQGAHLLIELFSQATGKVSVPVLPRDQLNVLALFYRQFQRNYGGIGSDTLYTMCRDICHRDSSQRLTTPESAERDALERVRSAHRVRAATVRRFPAPGGHSRY